MSQTNQQLMARRKQAVPQGPFTTTPFFAAKARGARVTDVEGREYIDFAGGIGVVGTAHNHPKILAAAKRQNLDSVEHHLARAYHRMEELIAENQDTYAVATELNALATSKQELKAIRTWPYNTEMFRTIFISIVTPLLVALARVAAVFLVTGRFLPS